MEKIYNRINWEDIPSTNTPLNAENLNKMDSALDEIDGRIVGMNGDLPTWDPNVNYTAGTSFVYWNQTIWECKLNCIGIEPSSSTANYWRAIDFATLSQRINTLNTDLTKLTDGKEMKFEEYNISSSEPISANTWSFTSFQLPAPPSGYTYNNIWSIDISSANLNWARFAFSKLPGESNATVSLATYALIATSNYSLRVKVIYAK